jgi:hypothetical protein
MIAEGRRRGDRLAIDAAAARRGRRVRRRPVDAGAQRCEPQRPLDFGGYRPGPVALVVGDVVGGRAAQAASRRQKRDRLHAIGLARAVRPRQDHQIAMHVHARRTVVAEMRQAQALDAGDGGHGESV